MERKKIIHIDMDYFFAQVEERDNPSLRDKPVAIGSAHAKRGVLCTSNYIARKYGVKSAMPTAQALKLCPHLVLVSPVFSKYQEASRAVFKLFETFTDKIQKLSIDEAYLDVTDCELFNNDAIKIAKEIKRLVFESTGLTCSAGVSFNKLLAKIGSDLYKPNGLAVLRSENIEQKISHFPISYLRGVGKVTQKKMNDEGLYTFGDVQKREKLSLINSYGSFGPTLFDFCRGVDHRDVECGTERKSLSVENTFADDHTDKEVLSLKLYDCFAEMKERLQKHKNRQIKAIVVTIRYDDFSRVTIERALNVDIENYNKLLEIKLQQRQSPIRLLGVGVRFFSHSQTGQLEFDLSA